MSPKYFFVIAHFSRRAPGIESVEIFFNC